MEQGAGWMPSAQSVGRAVNFLALSLPLALGCLMDRMRLRDAGLIAITAGLVFAAIAIRMDGVAALVGLFLGGLVFCGLVLVPQKGWVRLFDALAISVLAAPLLVWAGLSLFGAFGPSLPVSAHQRFFIWQATLEKISAKPIFGHGLDAAATWQTTFSEQPNWLALMPDGFSVVRIIPNHPHNMALHIWAEAGLVGAALLAAALALFGRRLPAPGAMSIGQRLAAAGLFGVAVTLFFVSYSAWDDSYWAGLALAASGLILAQARTDEVS